MTSIVPKPQCVEWCIYRYVTGNSELKFKTKSNVHSFNISVTKIVVKDNILNNIPEHKCLIL